MCCPSPTSWDENDCCRCFSFEYICNEICDINIIKNYVLAKQLHFGKIDHNSTLKAVLLDLN